MAGKISLRDAWAGFFGGADDAGIKFEGESTPAPIPAQSITTELISQPAVLDTSTADAERAEQGKALAAAQARIATLEADARTARFTAIAADWVGDKATHLKILAALEGDADLFAAYQVDQKAHAEQARQSALFSAAGSDRSGGGNSAWATIESKARLLMKEQPGMSFEQATVQVMDSDTTLYRQYIEESK